MSQLVDAAATSVGLPSLSAIGSGILAAGKYSNSIFNIIRLKRTLDGMFSGGNKKQTVVGGPGTGMALPTRMVSDEPLFNLDNSPNSFLTNLSRFWKTFGLSRDKMSLDDYRRDKAQDKEDVFLGKKFSMPGYGITLLRKDLNSFYKSVPNPTLTSSILTSIYTQRTAAATIAIAEVLGADLSQFSIRYKPPKNFFTKIIDGISDAFTNLPIIGTFSRIGLSLASTGAGIISSTYKSLKDENSFLRSPIKNTKKLFSNVKDKLIYGKDRRNFLENRELLKKAAGTYISPQQQGIATLGNILLSQRQVMFAQLIVMLRMYDNMVGSDNSSVINLYTQMMRKKEVVDPLTGKTTSRSTLLRRMRERKKKENDLLNEKSGLYKFGKGVFNLGKGVYNVGKSIFGLGKNTTKLAVRGGEELAQSALNYALPEEEQLDEPSLIKKIGYKSRNFLNQRNQNFKENKDTFGDNLKSGLLSIKNIFSKKQNKNIDEESDIKTNTSLMLDKFDVKTNKDKLRPLTLTEGPDHFDNNSIYDLVYRIEKDVYELSDNVLFRNKINQIEPGSPYDILRNLAVYTYGTMINTSILADDERSIPRPPIEKRGMEPALPMAAAEGVSVEDPNGPSQSFSELISGIKERQKEKKDNWFREQILTHLIKIDTNTKDLLTTNKEKKKVDRKEKKGTILGDIMGKVGGLVKNVIGGLGKTLTSGLGSLLMGGAGKLGGLAMSAGGGLLGNMFSKGIGKILGGMGTLGRFIIGLLPRAGALLMNPMVLGGALLAGGIAWVVHGIISSGGWDNFTDKYDYSDSLINFMGWQSGSFAYSMAKAGKDIPLIGPLAYGLLGWGLDGIFNLLHIDKSQTMSAWEGFSISGMFKQWWASTSELAADWAEKGNEYVPIVGGLVGGILGAAVGMIKGVFVNINDISTRISDMLDISGWLAEKFGWEPDSRAAKWSAFMKRWPLVGPFAGGMIGWAVDGMMSVFSSISAGWNKLSDMVDISGWLAEKFGWDPNSRAAKWSKGASSIPIVGPALGGFWGMIVDGLTGLFSPIGDFLSSIPAKVKSGVKSLVKNYMPDWIYEKFYGEDEEEKKDEDKSKKGGVEQRFPYSNERFVVPRNAAEGKAIGEPGSYRVGEAGPEILKQGNKFSITKSSKVVDLHHGDAVIPLGERGKQFTKRLMQEDKEAGDDEESTPTGNVLTNAISSFVTNLLSPFTTAAAMTKNIVDTSEFKGSGEKNENIVSPEQRAKLQESLQSQMSTLPASETLVWPSSDVRITSPFGPRSVSKGSSNHRGIDIGTFGRSGEPIYAVMGGKVVYSSFGSDVSILGVKSKDGTLLRYLHMSKHDVKKGDEVQPGQVLGLSGGERNFPKHLHLDVTNSKGERVNPELLFYNHLKSGKKIIGVNKDGTQIQNPYDISHPHYAFASKKRGLVYQMADNYPTTKPTTDEIANKDKPDTEAGDSPSPFKNTPIKSPSVVNLRNLNNIPNGNLNTTNAEPTESGGDEEIITNSSKSSSDLKELFTKLLNKLDKVDFGGTHPQQPIQHITQINSPQQTQNTQVVGDEYLEKIVSDLFKSISVVVPNVGKAYALR